MTFTLSLLIKGDASDAKAALEETGQAAKTASAEVKSLGSAGQRAGTDTRALGRAATSASGSVRTLGAAERATAADAIALGRANQVAAGQLGNLTSQFNDIGIMMMAGQNPLQLAVQQGTQITQVIGPMGAAGAARALGTAFLSLLSPINLITIGSIAAAAALSNWLTSSSREAETLGDTLDALSKDVDAVKSAARDALTPWSELRREFGANAAAARDAYDALLAIKQMNFADGMAKAKESFSKTFEDLKGQISAFNKLVKTGDPNLPATMTTQRLMLRDIRREYGLTIDQARKVQTALDELGRVHGPKEVATAAKKLREALQATADESGHIPDKLREAATAAAHLQLSAAAMEGSLGRSGEEARSLADIDIAGNIKSAADASYEMALQLGHALNFAQGISSISFPGLGEGTGGLSFKRSPWTLGTPVTGAESSQTAPGGWAMGTDVPGSGTSKSGRGRRGVSEVERQRKAIADLIATEQRRLAILRSTDPLEKAMLENSQALTGATQTQRDAVRQLIAERIAEQQQLAHLKDEQDFFNQTTYQALDGLIMKGHSLTDVMSNVAAAIAQAALQAAILGTGPLANLGSSGGSGLFGMIGSFLFPAKAAGGYLTGPGNGTSDSMLIAASSGEYVVNARATAAYRPLLEAINGGVPAFASGGAVGADFADQAQQILMRSGPPTGLMERAGGAQPNAGPAELKLHVTVDVTGAKGDAQIMAMAQEGAYAAIDRWSRDRLPGRFSAIEADRRRRG